MQDFNKTITLTKIMYKKKGYTNPCVSKYVHRYSIKESAIIAFSFESIVSAKVRGLIIG